ncbi:MAG: glycine cleavage system protein GcvH [Thermomicrobiales bacterium]|nr:glycine cleavage system protein GcvH [Thermomicrobiales bacterium]
MASPADLKYTRTHEWVRRDGDTVTIGITDHAQGELGDITYVELPEVGTEVAATQPMGIIESVKAATDLYAPVNGEVVAVNDKAVETPELLNSEPFGDAWLVKVRLQNPDQVAELMPATEYDAFAEHGA